MTSNKNAKPRAPRRTNGNAAGACTLVAIVALALSACSSTSSGTPWAAAPVPTPTTEQTPLPETTTDEPPIEEEATEEVPIEPFELALGEPAVITLDYVDAAEVTVTKIERVSQPSDEYSDPPENGMFWIASVKVESVGDQMFPINPFDFYVLDKAGNHYSYGDGSMYLIDKGELNAVDINAGERTSGKVVIDAPANATRLVYGPDDEAICYWDLAGSRD